MLSEGQDLVMSFYNISWVNKNNLMGRYFYLYGNFFHSSDLEKEELSILIDGSEEQYFAFLTANNLKIEDLKKDKY